MINIYFSYLTMSPHKCSQSTDKVPVKEAFASRSDPEEDVDTPEPVYNDTKGVIDKETLIKWGEVCQIFSNQTFP